MERTVPWPWPLGKGGGWLGKDGAGVFGRGWGGWVICWDGVGIRRGDWNWDGVDGLIFICARGFEERDLGRYFGLGVGG